MAHVQIFSKGKVEDRNEDFFGYTETCFVIADGATDKSGKLYDRKTGGEIVSRLVVREALLSSLVGIELVDFLNKKVHEAYRHYGITDVIADPKYRFTCGFICVRLLGHRVIVTYLGDLGFRVNGVSVYQEVKQIDIDNANRRSRYIKETGDLRGSREHIMPFLVGQFKYQNNADDIMGYGVIDGSETPEKFIKVFEYNIANITSIELFSDGYFAVPKEVTIDGWEQMHLLVEREDPDKWLKYPSVKSKDDRTIAILTF